MSSNGNDNLDNFSTHSGNITLGDNLSIDINNSSSSLAQSIEQNVKYEKLVQDYVKVRSKLTILKKAYVELNESSAQKDQSIRKYEQELEGLNFRNQQLTARVESLQRDLENLSANSANTNPQASSISQNSSTSSLPNSLTTSSNYFSSPSSFSSTLNTTPLNSSTSLASSLKNDRASSRLEILSEELQHKINENALLHRKLNEIELDFRQKLAKNEQLLKQIESEKLSIEKKFESSETAAKTQIEKLQNDKIKLELSIIQLENKLRETHRDSELKENELKKENEELHKQNNLLHVSSSSSLSSLGKTSTPIKKDPTPTSEDLLLNDLKTKLDSLSKIYFYIDERVKTTTIPGATHKQALKCEQTLTQQLVPFVQSVFAKNKSTNKPDFHKSLSEYFDANHQLFQAILIDLASANSNSSLKTNDQIETLNKKLKIYLNKLDVLFFTSDSSDSLNLSKLITQLVDHLLFSSQTLPNPTLALINSKLMSSLSALVDILDKILFVFNEKISVEYALDYPASLTTIDECMVNYVTQFKQSIAQMVSLVQTSNSGIFELLVKLVESVKLKALNENGDGDSVNESYNINKQFSMEKELESLKTTLSSKDAEIKELHEQLDKLRVKSQKDFDDTERLRFRLEQLQLQYVEIQKLEQEKSKELAALKQLELEKQIESQMVKFELEKAEPIKEIQVLAEPVLNTNVNINEPSQLAQDDADLDYKLLQSSTLETYISQIEKLSQRIQYLDSKAYYYYDEMKSMLERLKLQIDLNNLQEHDLNEIKDQLERTRSSYEVQMSTMSDHLIEMTDRMTKQADENEKLRTDLSMVSQQANQITNNKSSKSKKSK